MTAPDPRLGEMPESAIAAAAEAMSPVVKKLEAIILAEAALKAAHPILLAELRARDEKLARVEALLDQADEDRRVIQDNKPFARIADAVVDVGELRAAVAAATGGGE